MWFIAELRAVGSIHPRMRSKFTTLPGTALSPASQRLTVRPEATPVRLANVLADIP